ncbi:MAG: DUF2341 domain-containing protein, partial [Minisyncoccia bacterium]
GGSFQNLGAFTHNSGTVKMIATATGKTIRTSGSWFASLILDSASGGWTIQDHATTTAAFSITNATNFTLTANQSLSVGGTFTNAVGGAATTWATSTLSLVSGTSQSINTKTVTDTYGTLVVGANTDVRMWNSSAATTTVDSTGSLYSQDHANVNGDLYIWGDYAHASGDDYWSRTTDFDGSDISGSPRTVQVRVAPSSSLAFSGGSLSIMGAAGATTTIAVQGSGTYSFALSGGTLNAEYYQVRNTDANGLSISGTPSITSLSRGDFELGVNGGTMITATAAAIDANASLDIDTVRFATSTGISSGSNVVRSGTSTSAWNFNFSHGNYDGEAFDSDGVDSCGFIRWDDSSCLFVSQEHYRWRNDDGGEGAPTSDWYNASWSKRKKISVTNPGAALTNYPVRIDVDYDGDMQNDFDDLRFTSSTGTTSINYWIEEYTTSDSAIVWVEVPSLASLGSADIYMYYGNGSVSTTGDGTATFDFFDDFEDDNISEYSGNTSLFDVGTSFNHNGTYGLNAVDPEDKTTSGIYQTGSLVARGDTIRFFQYVDATKEDEPCTLFGVQGSAQNYAVCLDQYPIEQIVIAENVTSNDEDGSGTQLASTSVAYSTGWYEVEIDWLTDTSINVSVYEDDGDLFATLNTSDASYSSGGVGFAYWGQYGGWDFYSVREQTTEPTYVFGSEQTSGGATWIAAENIALSGQSAGENVRLRFSIQNTGSEITDQQFRLQVAPKGASLNCPSVPEVNYNDVPVAGSCGSAAMCMAPSTNFTDQESTSPHLSYPSAMNFASGKMVENASNQTNGYTVPSNTATEVEYNFQVTENASQSAYCLRVTNGGLALDNYDQVAEIILTHPPFINNFSLNSAFDIALTEGVTTTVMATATITDLNGFADISSATSTIYRSGVGPQCSANANSCYQVATSSCSLTNCSGNSCALSCSADIYYLADATDAGSSFEAENWLARVQVTDSSNISDVETSFGVDLLTLFGLTIETAEINFGSLDVGSDSGTTNATTTIRNTGNTNIDIQVAGTDLAGTGSTIAVGEQKYATSTFAYSGCAICNFLTGSATDVEVDLPKPTSTSTPTTDDLYFGINIPTGTGATLHQGTNTFIATSEE